MRDQRSAAGPVPLLPLDVAPYTRQVDTAWRRTSYSGLTASLHDVERGPGGFREDEPDEIAEEISVPLDGRALASPFADLPPGPPSEPSSTACWKPWTPTPTTSPRRWPPGAVSDWWHSRRRGEYRCAG